MNTASDIKYIVVDLFAGAGGTTIGFDQAINKLGKKYCAVVAAINHDPVAIKSHWINHPDVEHFEEDITKMYGMIKHSILFKSDHLIRLQRLVNLYRAFYPNAKLILWASLECTNFSNAKGGGSRIGESRTLAQHLDRYVDALLPDMIMIENVKEFKLWGPLKIKHKSIEVNNYKASALIGSKNKKTGIFQYSFEPISKLAGRDWIIWKQNLCENFDYKDDWKELNAADFSAFTARNRLFGLFVKPEAQFVWPEPTHTKSNKDLTLFDSDQKELWNPVRECLELEKKGKSIIYRKKPLKESTLNRHYNGLLKQLLKTDEEGFQSLLKENPLGLNNTFDVAFLSNYHGTGHNTLNINSPAGALVCADIHSAVFIDQQYSGLTNHQSIASPLWSITCNPKAALIHADGFIFNPGWFGNSSSFDNPCPVIVASQHKAPLSLVLTSRGSVKHKIKKSDSEIVKKIKVFMNFFGISDITMRMLFVHELKKIQGFPEHYVLTGTQKDQKKAIGNSVCPIVVTNWISAFYFKNDLTEKVAA